MKRILTALSVLLCSTLMGQQDIHFSQFYTAPTLLNPAATGAYHGDFSAYSNYRTQWRSFTGEPFTTFSASIDAPLRPQTGSNYFGIGATFFKDKAGSSGFTTSNYNLNVSYILEVGRYSYLAAGASVGILQRSIDFLDLYWESQWNGQSFDQAQSSGEFGFKDRFMTIDMGAGVYYFTKNDDGLGAYVGLSGKHLNRPDVSFLSKNERLLFKFTLHGGMEIPLTNPAFRIVPNALVVSQGPNQIINFGTDVKYMLSSASHSTSYVDDIAMSLGAYYRLNDAAYFAGRFQYAGLSFGMAYDVTVSDLNNYYNGAGGVEFFVSYISNLGNTAGISNFR